MRDRGYNMNLDNLNQLVGHGINIYGSRERIRRQLIDFAQSYLELKTVDFYKTSVVSYIIDTLSILSANHLFYDSMIYREFFMVEAQLQESVYNLARWIGYEIPKAIPSKVDILFTIPLTFNSPDITFTIPNNFKAKAQDIVFSIDSPNSNVASAKFNFDESKYKPSMNGKIINNSAISVRDGNGFYRPLYINGTDPTYASFTLPFTQHERIIEQFLIPETLQPYQFFSKKFQFDGMVSGVKVWLIEPDIGEKIILDTSVADQFNPENQLQSYGATRESGWYQWVEWEETINGIYTLSPNSTQFVFVGGINQAEIFFGNGIIGRQPSRNSAVTVEFYITQGDNGHIIPNSITQSDKLYYTIQARYGDDGVPTSSDITSKIHNIAYEIMNPIHSQGGVGTPTLPEIKRNAIVNLRSKAKLVSEMDYNDINIIMGPKFPTVQAYPILKRSDIKVNEIMAFILLQYHDESYLPQIVPTRNAKISIIDPSFNSDGEYTIMRTSEVLIDDEYYQTLFNITLNNDTRIAHYDYILQNVKGSPTIMYNQVSPSWYQQYSYMPITGIDFDVVIEDGDTSSSSSSSSVYDSNHVYPLMVRVNVNHIPQDMDSDYIIEDYRCKMITKWDTNQQYDQILSYPTVISGDTGYQYFEFQIPNYQDIPSETQRYEFIIEAKAIRRDSSGNIIDVNGNIYDPMPSDIEITDDPEQFIAWQPLSKYYCDIIVRKDLSDVMMSSITKTDTWDNVVHDMSYKYTVHNVPVILSNYLDDGDNGGIINRSDNSIYPNFEVTVMQALITNLELDDKRMLTDYINIKFPDTYGRLNNLKYNPVDYTIRSRFKTPFNWEEPDDIIWNQVYHGTSSSSSDYAPASSKYIVNGPVPNYEMAGKNLSSYINYIATYYENAGWYLTKPKRETYVRIEDELDSSGDQKIIVYDGHKWKDVQSFKIPLLIDLKIEIDPNTTTNGDELKHIIKDELIDHFSPYMGVHKNLDRSEIVTVVRQIPGVQYCEVRKPEVDIKFNYDIQDLTQKELLDYTPQYIGMVAMDRNHASDVQDDGIQIEIVR